MTDLPRYAKLRNLLREKIISGTYSRGDRFFSQAELMKKYGLSFATVTRALDELVRAGYLVREQGKGTFIESTDEGNRSDKSVSVLIFVPWATGNSLLTDASSYYRYLETSRPDWLVPKLIPYSDDHDGLEAYLFSRDRIDAAIFLTPPADLRQFIAAVDKQYPTLTISDHVWESLAHQLVLYPATAAKLATEHFIEMGHTKIAVVAATAVGKSITASEQGYRQALAHAGLEYDSSLVRITSHAEIGAYHETLELFQQNDSEGITAIFASDLLIAAGVQSALQSTRLSIPDDISIVCLDNLGKSSLLSPPLTSVEFSPETLAIQTIEAISAMLFQQTAPAIDVAPSLVLRHSTRSIRTPSQQTYSSNK